MTAKLRLWVVAIALLSMATVAGCKAKPSEGDCKKLRTHLIELESAAGGAGSVGTDEKADLEAQKKAIESSVPLDFCMDEMSAEQVQCGLKARTLEDLEKVCNKS